MTQWRPNEYSCKDCAHWEAIRTIFRDDLGICEGVSDHQKHVLKGDHTICSGFDLKEGL